MRSCTRLRSATRCSRGVSSATSWRKGSRAVTDTGEPIRPADLPVDGVITVFPDGAVGTEDSQTLLIRLPAGAYRPLPGREDWAPGDVEKPTAGNP